MKYLYSLYLYTQIWFNVDGTSEFGQGLRWLYLFGQLNEKHYEKLDARNFKKWKKINQKEFDDYLKVARV